MALRRRSPSAPQTTDGEITGATGSSRDGDRTSKEGSTKRELIDQLVQSMAEADTFRQNAYEELIRRSKAEQDAIWALLGVVQEAASQGAYNSHVSRRVNEIEEELARSREELENVKRQLDEVTRKLRVALDKKSYLETEIANYDLMVLDLNQKMSSAVEMSKKHKEERDDALRNAEELRKNKQPEESSNTSLPQFFLDFSYEEMKEATRNFDPLLKIGEEHNASIYRATLHHTQVVIKKLHSHNFQEASEFVQEVNVLSQLRHPNLVTLVGACPESCILIYEYLPSGSLEDRLNCKDNTPPLPWQTRVRIAAELCSALVFIHSCSIAHGDVKPANLLLDANFVSKLSNFGLCRVLSDNDISYSNNDMTPCHLNDPDGTLAYLDPEFLDTGELTPKCDVYSFGIVCLRLLTGKPAMKIAKEVQTALDRAYLDSILDPTAGDWSFLLAKQLAHLALRCCEKESRNRPDLASEVLRVLESMKLSSGALPIPLATLNSEEEGQIPHHFICPIFQEIMEEPVVAADGFTYEAEALRGWFRGGHDTSPMTNLKLGNKNLVPNHALRAAIQDWLQQPSSF